MREPEPQIGHVVLDFKKSGRIDVVTEYERIVVVGVKYEGQRVLHFYSMNELRWNDDHWVVIK